MTSPGSGRKTAWRVSTERNLFISPRLTAACLEILSASFSATRRAISGLARTAALPASMASPGHRWMNGTDWPATKCAAGAEWLAPKKEAQLEWSTNQAGVYTLAVQFIDRDLNYSPPTVAVMTIVPPWYLNPKIAGPLLVLNLGLLCWAFFARTL